MRFKTVSSPHKLSPSSVTRVMFKVLCALLPGTAASIYFFGWGVVTNLVSAIVLALLAEGLMLAIRKRPVWHSLQDLSAVVTAWLLALAMPAYAPIWLIAVGILFAIVFGKQLYGGLGLNPFNPAMLGYVVLLISFPVNMTQWPSLDAASSMDLAATLSHVFGGHDMAVDALSGATALDYTNTQLSQAMMLSEISDAPVYGVLGAAVWEWIAAAYAVGGIALILLRVMPWHAPVAMLLSLFCLAETFQFYDPDSYSSGLFHLFSGGAMLGAFFIITDPVSGATSNRGRLVFGALAGLLIYVIRTWGGYPDGIAFSVLLMNMAAPTIDHFCKTQVFGTGKGVAR